MVYVISFLSVAAVPLAVAGYGGHLAAKLLDRPERLRALIIVWALATLGVVLSGVQQIIVYRSDRAHEQQQAALEAKAEEEQRQLREKLDASLNHADEVRKELGSIVKYLNAPQPRMSARAMASAASKMVEDAMHR
jgi:type VI protein secretion system component VasK